MSNSINNRWLAVITLLLLIANIITLALLWTNKKTGKENFDNPPAAQQQAGGQVFEFVARELKLDSAQQETYKKFRGEHRLRVRPYQDSIGKAKDSFFALLKNENITDSMVEASSKKIGSLEQQKDIITFRHFQKLRAICNKEQQIKFDSIIQETMHMMAPPKHQGPPRRERSDGESRNDENFDKPGMRPDGNRSPPPPEGMRPPHDRPPPPDGMRPPKKDSI